MRISCPDSPVHGSDHGKDLHPQALCISTKLSRQRRMGGPRVGFAEVGGERVHDDPELVHGQSNDRSPAVYLNAFHPRSVTAR